MLVFMIGLHVYVFSLLNPNYPWMREPLIGPGLAGRRFILSSLARSDLILKVYSVQCFASMLFCSYSSWGFIKNKKRLMFKAVCMVTCSFH